MVDTLQLVRAWTEAGLLPTTFTTLKLGEAHTYFHTNPGAVMFLNGSWYTSRAFNPPDKGGQPEDFPLGIMKFPSIPGAACNECRTIVSAAAATSANAATKHPKEAIAFLNSFATPEIAAIAGSRTCWFRPASRRTTPRSAGRTPATSRISGATSEGASTTSARRSR